MTSDLKIYSVFASNNGAASPDQAESLRCGVKVLKSVHGNFQVIGEGAYATSTGSLVKVPTDDKGLKHNHNLHI